MPIEFRCVQCQKLLRVGDDAVGKKARCPDCGTIQEAVGGAVVNQAGFPPATDSPSFSPLSKPVSQPANPFSDQASSPSPFAQFGSNPYLAPQTPGSPPPPNLELIRSKVQGPATGMLVISAFVVVTQVLGIAGFAVAAALGRTRLEDLIQTVFGLVFGVAFSSLILMGSIKMRKLENYGLAMTAAILATLPCTSPCCLVSIPFGIWSLVVLLDEQVKRAFR